MNLVDANVLVYATNRADPKHEDSRQWLEGAFSRQGIVGFAWMSVLAFIRLSTKVGLFPRPLSITEALDAVRAWMDQPTSVVVEPSVRHLEILAGLLVPLGAGGNLTSDAHRAALAVEYDATVVTYDSDFGRFAGVRWQPPR